MIWARLFAVWMLWSAGQAGFAGFYTKQVAVVIGIDIYTHPAWSHLNYAVRDARSVAGLLEEAGFEVFALYDGQATRQRIQGLFEDRLPGRLGADDAFVFFFSGHGTTRELGGQDRGFIVPVDGGDLVSSYISMDNLRTYARYLDLAKHQAYILDCCFGGSLGIKAGRIPPTIPDYLNDVARRRARQILSAGDKDQQVVDGGPFGLSLFTGYIVRAVREGFADLNQDGWITFNELYSYVLPAAANQNQSPGYATLEGHEQGELLLPNLANRALARVQSQGERPAGPPETKKSRGDDTFSLDVPEPKPEKLLNHRDSVNTSARNPVEKKEVNSAQPGPVKTVVPSQTAWPKLKLESLRRVGNSMDSLSGLVVDKNGEVLPGALITVAAIDGSYQRSAVSNARGIFRVLAPRGLDFKLTVEMTGFNTLVYMVNE